MQTFGNVISRLPDHHVEASKVSRVFVTKGVEDVAKTIALSSGAKHGLTEHARAQIEREHEGSVSAYDREDGTLVVPGRISRGQGSIRHTITHEFAHSIEQSMEGTELRNEWERTWGEEIQSFDGKDGLNPIGAYAASSSEEGFSECYAQYHAGGVSRRSLKDLAPQTHAFLQRLEKAPSLLKNPMKLVK